MILTYFGISFEGCYQYAIAKKDLCKLCRKDNESGVRGLRIGYLPVSSKENVEDYNGYFILNIHQLNDHILQVRAEYKHGIYLLNADRYNNEFLSASPLGYGRYEIVV